MTTDRDRIAALLAALSALAAGLWRVEGDRLALAAFVPAADLAPEVATAFAEATRSVPLDRPELGIVRAAIERVVAVSIASDLPPHSGSGLWLRAFGAERSVAVPLLGSDGRVAAVASVALPASSLDEAAVAEVVRDAMRPA